MSVEAPVPTGVVPEARRDPMPPALLGVILFVASECVFFAALFGAYFTVRAGADTWPPAVLGGKPIAGLEAWPISAIATSLLVLSSVMMQFSVWAFRRGDRATMLRFLT